MNVKGTDAGRHLSDLDFLLDVTRETLSTVQLGSLLRRVARMLRERFGYDYAAVALVQRDEVVFRAGSGGAMEQAFLEEGKPPSWRVPIGQGIVGTAVHARKARLSYDVSSDPDYVSVSFLSQTRSELAVPLINRDRVLGALDVQSNRPNAFDETDAHLLEIVAALVAPAIDMASLYERERMRSRHLHLVSEISRLVLSSLDRENVISVACEAILDALDISFVAVGLLDPAGARIRHGGHATRLALDAGAIFELALGEGVVGSVIASGKPRLINDVQTCPELKQLVAGMRSALCVPLRIQERVIGAINVEHSEVDSFSDEDLRLLENIGVYLAQAMENAQLFDNQRRRWQQLLVINEMARIATECLDLGEMMAQVAKEVHDRFGYFAVAVYLKEDDSAVLRALYCENDLALGSGSWQRLGDGIAGQAVQLGQVVQVDRREDLPPGSALRDDVQSVLCVPLQAQSGVIGAIEVQCLKAETFSPDDRLVMHTLAQSVAGAISNAQTLQQTEQLREDVNQMIVHDLRNPVQAVLLTLQEVQRNGEAPLPPMVVEAVKEGIGCSEDILEMINSLLDVSRFEAGKAQLRLQPAALNDHIRATVRRYAPQARSKRVQITTVLSQEVPVLRIDPELLSRTIANLVGNAVKFTTEGARVTIRSDLVAKAVAQAGIEPPFVLVSVQDNGEGIPSEYHDKIFEKYGQVESRKAGLKMSTGLGLALCRYVVRAHGGQIWVNSTPGRGSTFSFSLPIRPPSGA